MPTRNSAQTTTKVRSDGRVTIDEDTRELLDIDGGEIVELDITVRKRPDDD